MKSNTIIFIDADHNGIDLAKSLYNELIKQYYVIALYDKYEMQPYPIVAQRMVYHILHENNAKGILVCKTGTGMQIVSNRFTGIFANNCQTIEECIDFRANNNGNLLCLGAKYLVFQQALDISNVFITAAFEDKNLSRINLIQSLTDTRCEFPLDFTLQ